MINICIIGNSHVACLKNAWDTICKNHPKIKITFFAAHSRRMESLVARKGELYSNNQSLTECLEFTSNGKKAIDVNEYELFVLCGLTANPYFPKKNQFFSRAAIEKALHDYSESTVLFKLLILLRTLTEKPALIAFNPLIAAEQVSVESSHHDYLAGIQLLNDVIFHPLKAQLIPQPLETIVDGNRTHLNFSKNSKWIALGRERDNKYHPKRDNHHMNDKFGELWLKLLLNKCTRHVAD